MKHLKLYEEHTNNSSEMVSIKKETLLLLIRAYGYGWSNSEVFNMLPNIDRIAADFKYWGIENFQEYVDAYKELELHSDKEGYVEDYVYSDVKDGVVKYAGIYKIYEKMGLDSIFDLEYLFKMDDEYLIIDDLHVVDDVWDNVIKYIDEDSFIDTIEHAEKFLILYTYYEKNVDILKLYELLYNYKPESIKHLLDLEIINQDDYDRFYEAKKHKDIIDL